MNLREIFEKHLEGEPYINFDDFEQAIADYEKSKWVSCDERLPDSNFKYPEVLVVSDECFDRPYIGYYNAEMSTWYLRDDEDSIELVTHWQPLPKAPKP